MYRISWSGVSFSTRAHLVLRFSRFKSIYAPMSVLPIDPECLARSWTSARTSS